MGELFLFHFSPFICNAFLCLCQRRRRVDWYGADILFDRSRCVFDFQGGYMLVLENKYKN